MTLEDGLFAHLTTTATVAPFVGDRVYPVHLPADTALPALTYQIVSTTRLMTHDGAVSGADQSRIQINCHGASPSEARVLAHRLKSLHGFRGAWDLVPVHCCQIVNSYDIGTDQTTGRTQVAIDVQVRFTES